MSVERAQKSEVHEVTDDATRSPANRTEPGRAADVEAARDDGTRPDTRPDETDGIVAGPGASDGYSGGGPGSNNPDAETALRVDDAAFTRGDPDEDRRKLFPDAPTSGTAQGPTDDLRIKNDPDESSFGGPLRIDDPSQ